MDSIWIHTGATVINSFSELYGCIPVVSVQFFCPPEKNTNLKVTLWSGRCVRGPSCYSAPMLFKTHQTMFTVFHLSLNELTEPVYTTVRTPHIPQDDRLKTAEGLSPRLPAPSSGEDLLPGV